MRAWPERGGEDGSAALWGTGLSQARRRQRHVSDWRKRRPGALAGARDGRRAEMGQQVGRVGEPGAASFPPPPSQQQPLPPPLSQSQAQPRGLRGSSNAPRPHNRRRDAAAPRGTEGGFNVFAQHGTVGGGGSGGRHEVGRAGRTVADPGREWVWHRS